MGVRAGSVIVQFGVKPDLAATWPHGQYNATRLKEIFDGKVSLLRLGKLKLSGGQIPPDGRAMHYQIGAVEVHKPVEPTFTQSALIAVHQLLEMPDWCVIDAEGGQVGTYWCSGVVWIVGIALLIYAIVIYYRCKRRCKKVKIGVDSNSSPNIQGVPPQSGGTLQTSNPVAFQPSQPQQNHDLTSTNFHEEPVGAPPAMSTESFSGWN